MTPDRFKNITLQQLEILVALIDAGSFTKATTRLFLTQPSLTKQIQNMEEAVGSRLINRGPGGITLTPEGRIMYEYARRILRLRDDAKRRISQLKEEESGHIYISASTIPSTYIIPKLLGILRQTYPNIQIHINSHDSEEVIQIVLHGEAELGFIGKEPTHKKLMAERIWKDCLVLAVPIDHPLAKRESVTIEEVAKIPFIVREKGSATRDIIETCLQNQHGIGLDRFNVVCEVGSSEAVKEAILAGIGISIISCYAIARELSQSLLKPVTIRDCTMERYFYLIYRYNFHLMKYHKYFIDIVKKYTPQLHAPSERR